MMTYQSSPDSDLVEIRVEGSIGKADIEGVFARFQADVARHGKVRVLEVIGKITGVEPAAVWRDLQLGLPMMHKVSRAAVVTDQSCIGVMTDLAAPFVGAEVKRFAMMEIDVARAWLTHPDA